MVQSREKNLPKEQNRDQTLPTLPTSEQVLKRPLVN